MKMKLILTGCFVLPLGLFGGTPYFTFNNCTPDVVELYMPAGDGLLFVPPESCVSVYPASSSWADVNPSAVMTIKGHPVGTLDAGISIYTMGVYEFLEYSLRGASTNGYSLQWRSFPDPTQYFPTNLSGGGSVSIDGSNLTLITTNEISSAINAVVSDSSVASAFSGGL